jgi:hypothetical protein
MDLSLAVLKVQRTQAESSNLFEEGIRMVQKAADPVRPKQAVMPAIFTSMIDRAIKNGAKVAAIRPLLIFTKQNLCQPKHLSIF